MLVYATVIGFTDNYVRVIATDAGLWQFHATRTAMALVILAVAAVPLGLRLRPKRARAVLARSAIHGTAMVIYFGALAFLPVAQVAAGLFTAPIFVLLIQRFAFGQPISRVAGAGGGGRLCWAWSWCLGPRRCRGQALAALLPVIAGALYAMGNIATRAWCADESAETLLAGFFGMLGVFGLIGMAVLTLLPVEAAAKARRDSCNAGRCGRRGRSCWWTFVQAAGSLLGVGMMIRAYQMAEAARVSVFEYVILPASAFWTWVIWGETLVWYCLDRHGVDRRWPG